MNKEGNAIKSSKKGETIEKSRETLSHNFYLVDFGLQNPNMVVIPKGAAAFNKLANFRFKKEGVV